MWDQVHKAMRWSAIRLSFAVVVNLSGMLATSHADSRLWSSAQGGSSIEAEFVSATESTVTIRRVDNGKKVTVPLAKLSEADRKFVANEVAKSSKKENIDDLVKRKALRFYQVLRKTDRADLKPLLSAAAQAAFDSNSTTIDNLTPADRNTSPRFKGVTIEKERAIAELSVKIMGKYREVFLILEPSDDDWSIYAIAYKDDEGAIKQMSLVTGDTSEGLAAPPQDASAVAADPSLGSAGPSPQATRPEARTPQTSNPQAPHAPSTPLPPPPGVEHPDSPPPTATETKSETGQTTGHGTGQGAGHGKPQGHGNGQGSGPP